MKLFAATPPTRILAAGSCIIAILLAVSSRTCLDEAPLRQSSPRGAPLHLLPDEQLVEAYRSIGYVTTLTCQQPLDSLFCGMLGGEETPTTRYIGDEIMRYQRLTGVAFHTATALELYERVLPNPVYRRIYYRLTQRQRYCFDKMYVKGPPSPDIADSIEASITDFKRLGLENWAGYDYETYAFYESAIDEDERARDFLEKALACHVANGEILLASKVAGDIGKYFLGVGDVLRSEDAFLMSQRYATESGDRDFLSRSLFGLARLRASQGYFAESESLLVRALERGGGTVDPSSEITELIALAELYTDSGEYARAGTFLDRAILRIQTDLADPALVGNRNHRYNLMRYLSACLSDQASIQSARRQRDAASASVRKALELAAATNDSSLKAELLARLGEIATAAGHPEDAARSYAAAFSIAKRKHDPSSEAKYAHLLGLAYLDRRRFDEADAWLATALKRGPTGGSRMQEVDILHSMARAKGAEKDDAAAKMFLERAIATLEAGDRKSVV
jgi:tetratricopeptide (TPR) repeat protein